MNRLITVFLLGFASLHASGQLVPVYEPPVKPDYRQAAEVFRSGQLLERTAIAVNSTVRIPVRMPLVLTECGLVNAFYVPMRRAVVICYELVEQVMTGIQRDFGQASDEDKAEAAAGTLIFILLHEIGHGLVHTLELPVLGKGEDAADAIATYIVLNGRDPLQSIIGTLWFFSRGASQPSIKDFADEHSLGQQRAFSLICHAVGKDPNKYGQLAERFGLPIERAKRCPAEYENLRKSARALLGKNLNF